MKKLFYGSFVALITPFDERQNINWSKLAQLIKFHLDNGTDGLVIGGTTAEVATMSETEHEQLLHFAIKQVQGQVPIIAGVGSNNTQKTINMSQKAQALGVDALLVVTPYYNQTNDEGLYQHFYHIAKNVDVPIFLYNVPSRTNMDLTYQAIKRLSHIDNIIGIKEASGNLKKIAKITKNLPDFIVFSGNDDQIYDVLKLGGHGVISVFANLFPRIAQQICAHAQDNPHHASALQQQYLPFIQALFLETNPIGIKAIMNYAGLAVGSYRLPLFEMSKINRDRLIKQYLEVLNA